MKLFKPCSVEFLQWQDAQRQHAAYVAPHALTGSLKRGRPAATKLSGPLERQTDGSPRLLPGVDSKHFLFR